MTRAPPLRQRSRRSLGSGRRCCAPRSTAARSGSSFGGAFVVLDPKDGAVLAMASSPTYDPARVGSANTEALRNRAISWTYEPGSTLKAVTIAAALDKGVVTPSTSYQDVGYAVIGGRTLCNAQCKVYGPTTVTQVLTRSQNAGAVFVASKLGAGDLNAY